MHFASKFILVLVLFSDEVSNLHTNAFCENRDTPYERLFRLVRTRLKLSHLESHLFKLAPCVLSCVEQEGLSCLHPGRGRHCVDCDYTRNIWAQ